MSVILITDDNSDYRHAVMDVLRLEGYHVIEATDGAAAMELVHAQPPDLILCDIDMPVMDGFAVLAALKADPATAPIPFFIISGRDDPETLARGRQLDADDHMIKPMNVDLLLDKIRAVLGKGQSIIEP
jgi:CheY-like chemotaxis protein